MYACLLLARSSVGSLVGVGVGVCCCVSPGGEGGGGRKAAKLLRTHFTVRRLEVLLGMVAGGVANCCGLTSG